jgi:exodeoxyribonuclease VII small subunit
MADTPIGYAAALAELEAILRELDDDRIDIDVLAAKVQRASQLITVCRERITAAQIQIDEILASTPGADDES